MPRLSLRARLLFGVLVLAAAGLFAADAVTYTSLRSSLLSRVDSTLESEHHGAENAQFGWTPARLNRTCLIPRKKRIVTLPAHAYCAGIHDGPVMCPVVVSTYGRCGACLGLVPALTPGAGGWDG